MVFSRTVHYDQDPTYSTDAVQIQWFGRHGRTNAFAITDEDASLPACDLYVRNLLAEVLGLYLSVSDAPNTEILQFRPVAVGR